VSTCESVCIGVDVDERATFCTETTPIARKEHQCCECAGTIHKGERYLKSSGVWDGEFNTYRQCWPCQEIQRTFSCGEGWYYGGLWEAWADADGFRYLTVRDKCFQKLSLPTRQFLIERWWKWKEQQKTN